MINFVYKLSFEKTSLELNDDYERFSEGEKENISGLDAGSYYDYDNDGYNCFIITTAEEMYKYLNILKANFIRFKYYDISDEILYNKYNLDELKDKTNPFNIIKWDFFTEDLNIWILENLEIDIVLDRITEVGFKNLTKIELDFLKELNNSNNCVYNT
jgi:hypothetical protein